MVTAQRQLRTQALITEIWRRSQPQVMDRIALLERAAEAAASHGLVPELRVDATSIAHKLAGSLGMFGYSEGTRIAREIEIRLQDGASDGQLAELAELTSELRRALPAPASEPGLAGEVERSPLQAEAPFGARVA